MHPKIYERIHSDAKEEEIEKELEKQRNGLGNDFKDDSVERALLNFIIKERLPLSKLESIHLNHLIQGDFFIHALIYYCIECLIDFNQSTYIN